MESIRKYSSEITTTNIMLNQDCIDTTIPSVLLTTLSNKNLEIVHIWGRYLDSDKVYIFNDAEIKIIAQGKWKWLWIEEESLKDKHYSILRNNQPPERI